MPDPEGRVLPLSPQHALNLSTPPRVASVPDPTGPGGPSANRASLWEGKNHLQDWGWSQDPASSGAVVVVLPSVQDLQGRPLGKASVHLPSSVVHSWLLEKKKKKKKK